MSKKIQEVELTPKQVMEHLTEQVEDATAFLSVILDQEGGVSFGTYNLGYNDAQKILEYVSQIIEEQKAEYTSNDIIQEDDDHVASLEEDDPGFEAADQDEMLQEYAADSPYVLKPTNTIH